MSDMDDEQIKAEIDGIMKGVKTIMQKIEACLPKTPSCAGPSEDRKENLDSSKNTKTD